MRRFLAAMRRSRRLFGPGVVVGLVLLAVPAAASAAGPGDGGPGQKACEEGGYVNYATTTGTKFKNEGQCVSYVAQGGTLVPLPDLVPLANCTSSSSGVDCTFEVKNIGIGPAVGQVELQAGLTMNVTDPASFHHTPLSVIPSRCDFGFGGRISIMFGENPVLTLAGSRGCNNITVEPGAIAMTPTDGPLRVRFVAGGTGSPGTIAVNAAVITPILERNTNNNTLSQTFTTTGT